MLFRSERDLPFDPIRDFSPVGQVATGYYVIVVHPSLPVRGVKDLIALARSRPGELNYGSGGTGQSTHLAMAYLMSLTGMDMLHVPYKGSGAAVTQLLAGQIQLMFANITAAVPHVKTGRIRAIASSGVKRSQVLPQLPTVAESGMPALANYDVTSWFGLLVPARTPPEVIAKLNSVLTTAMNSRDMRERLAHEGAEPVPSTAAEFGKHMAREVAIWGKVVKIAGVQKVL